MKKYLMKNALSILGLFVAGIVNAQTGTENYVQSKTCLNGDCTKKSETITYFDGLGRAKQIIRVKATPTGKDMVKPIVYDAFGRQTKDILPVPASTANSQIHTGITNENTANSYYGGFNAFTEKEIENSPLERVLQQANAGDPWQLGSGHTKRLKYEANGAGEVLNFVTTTSVNTVNNVSNSITALSVPSGSSAYYGAGTLYKNTTIDEDGTPVIQFTNGRGEVLLIRKTDGDQNIDTYYVYNEYGHKAFVIPPLAVKQMINDGNVISQDVLDDLCYQYRYDDRDREVEKKLPGKDWEYFVYDKQDRVILTQDGVIGTDKNNFNTKGWIFTKYDQYDRIAYTGFFASGDSRQVLQNTLDNIVTNASNNEKRGGIFSQQGILVEYDKQAFPTGNMTILSINYYDTYPREINHIPEKILDQYTIQMTPANAQEVSAKSLKTATYLKNVEDDSWTKTYYFYDTKGRVIGTNTKNHLGGYTNKEMKLDFTGEVEQSFTYHKRSPNDSEVLVKERFIYDDQGRVLKQFHQVDNFEEELLAENTYNEIGQLINKKTGNNNGEPLQSVDYTYNIRGWLTSVNNPNTPAFDGKLFGFELKYENPASGESKYNGNISEFDWKSSKGDMLRRYSYSYDKLERLLDARYFEPTATVPVTDAYRESLSYDENGNIKTLRRFQAYGSTPLLIDDLNYIQYKGNQLIRVIDNSTNGLGYTSGGEIIDYDMNGNMINHIDKGIGLISYNFLNLPKEIVFKQGGLSFIYRADGVKLKKVYTSANPTVTTEYLDGFQYENNSLQFFPTSEGFYDYTKKKYIYNYKDQLGNVRLAYFRGEEGKVVVERETNYYPFGLEYADNSITATQLNSYKYKYQGQELQETGFYSFKWRNYMPDVGRFFNIDPLSEKFPYNSTYAFQENKLGMGREFEGLELVPFEFLMMSNSAIEPAIPLAEAGIREMPIEPITITVSRATPPSPPGFWERIGNWFDSLVDGNSESTAPRTMDKTVENLKPESTTESATSETGKIYRVPGEQTESGKPYIGRTKQRSPMERGRGANDGRNRGGETEVIDKYDPKNPGEGAYKEQKAIDKEGGVENLDNKRNEVKPERMKELENKYGPTKHQ